MAFGFSTYVDPGVYQTEVIVPSGVNIPLQPFTVCLIGTASRNKRVLNEPVLRGFVNETSLSLGASVSGYRPVTLANRAVRRKETTTLFRSYLSIENVIDDQYFRFRRASLTSPAIGGTIALDTAAGARAIAVQMDGKEAITIVFVDGSPAATSVVGRQVTVTSPLGGTNGASSTPGELRDAINLALAAHSDYGSEYNDAASLGAGNAIVLTSQIDGVESYVRVFEPAGAGTSATTLIFGAASVESGTVVEVSDAVYQASATWRIQYARATSSTDPLEQTSNITSVVSVGSNPGAADYSGNASLSGNLVSWSGLTAATVSGQVLSPATVNLSGSNDTLVVQVDQLLPVTVDLNALASPPLGYANPSNAAAATPAEIADNVNAVLSQQLGPRYRAVASVVGGNQLVLTSPTLGRGSYVEVSAGTGSSALLSALFNSRSGVGTGIQPSAGTVYFTTYEYLRPSTEYNVPYLHRSFESVKALIGSASSAVASYSPLSIAAELAFENGAEQVYTVQINDATTAGIPTQPEVLQAIAGAATQEWCSEVIVVGEPGTRSATVTQLVTHLEEMCSPVERYYRRIFVGGPLNMVIGDRTTTNSMIGWATGLLQVAPSSPGRGRMFMVAPPQAAGLTRIQLLEDGSTIRLALDSSYLAVAVAAKKVSLPTAADTLTKQTITGFNLDDISRPWLPAERRALASQGVCVVSYDGGTLRILDALTTEGGRGNLVAFRVDSTSYQKDVITKKVNQALFDNAVGVVPYDVASFILDIKLIIQSVLVSEVGRSIGPYRDTQSGATRAIDLRTDIRVSQDVNNLTQFNFAYWYNLRYPALRFFGEYSVDNPFFSAGA